MSYNNELYPYTQNETPEPGAPAPEPQRKQKRGKAGKTVALVLCSALLCGAMGFGGGMLASSLSDTQTSSSGVTVQQATANSESSAGATQLSNTTSAQLSIEEIAAKAADSVVEITTESVTTGEFLQQSITQGAGSGVIISTDGYILTNYHVIEGASTITVTPRNGNSYPATLVGVDDNLDVALLKIEETNLSPATFGDSSSLKVGETAVAIGNPLGQLGGTVTNGIISALDRDITIDGKTKKLLQTNAAINPGNSGGGLFNDKGQLIGLVVAKSSGEEIEGLGFAIPINDVVNILDDLKQYGYVKGRISLGVSLLDISSQQMALMYRVGQTGCYIYSTVDGSAAAKAGLRSGDCITAINGTEVSTSEDVKTILDTCSVGDTIQMTILRNGESATVSVTLQEYVTSEISNTSTTVTSNSGSGLIAM